MTIGLSKRLKVAEVQAYKAEWEARCANDVKALSRQRFTYYYSIYKNPQRLLSAYNSLSTQERQSAVARLIDNLKQEEARKVADELYGYNAVPRMDSSTQRALNSVYLGEAYPSYIPVDVNEWEPGTHAPSQDHFEGAHHYDLWCQVIGQTLAAARDVSGR